MPDLDYQGIVVLGSPRSGTTLLRRLLNAHPSISSPPETNLLSAAARFIEEIPVAGGISVGPLSGLEFCGYSSSDTLDRLREFVFGFFREIAQKSGKPVWAEKTAFDGFHADAIEKVCAAHVRYVCLVRHPLDVVCSIKELSDKMGVYLPELHHYVQRHPAPLEAFAHAWTGLNERLLALRDRQPDYAFALRYEDLVADTAPTLERLLGFLELPAPVEPIIAQAMGGKDTVGFGDWKTYQRKSISAASVGRWAALDDDTVARLVDIVGPTMARLGYDPVEVERPDQEEARRQYELGLMIARMKEPGQ